MKLISMRCSNCNGVMEADAEQKEIYCPFCGTKQMIVESDAVTIEKMRIENENAKEQRTEDKQELNLYRKSKFSKVTIVLAVIALLGVFISFQGGHILAGMIAILQVALLAVSWLMGMQIIKEPKKFIHTALAILAIVLVVPYISANSMSRSIKHDTADEKKELGDYKWPNNEVGRAVPKPDSEKGLVEWEYETSFNVCVEADADLFADYVDELMDAGFTVDYAKLDTMFHGSNADGIYVSVSLEDNGVMDITARLIEEEVVPETETEMESETETESEVVADMPDTQDSQAPEDGANAGNVDPDLKAFLDEYEAFMDDYIAFMKEYKESDNVLKLATDYAKFMSDYADFGTKAAQYEAKQAEMSAEDLEYYLLVMNRINEKLAKAAL